MWPTILPYFYLYIIVCDVFENYQFGKIPPIGHKNYERYSHLYKQIRWTDEKKCMSVKCNIKYMINYGGNLLKKVTYIFASK